jgi:EAL domain-containing protein (putative c-di-GMP-specific phosphodiesterase class I)
VETEDQLAFLAGAGCREIQGFLVSRPLTPEALEDFLAARLTEPPPG